MYPPIFHDRADAGRQLGEQLIHAGIDGSDLVVLGLPRGGIPVAAEVARKLGAPLDVLPVRKLGVPGHEELAMGAIALGGARVLNEDVVSALGISQEAIIRAIQREERELARRAQVYRGDLPAPEVARRSVVLVDDGLATGATMRAAIAFARDRNALRVIVAIPVAPAQTLAEMRALADEVVCVAAPEQFRAVGPWYRDFAQVSDDDVRRALRGGDGEASLIVPAGDVELYGDLAVPDGAGGLVVFAHGSGSSRLSARNRFVAQALQARGLATLLFDLLTAEEERRDAIDAHLRFDIPLLAERLGLVTDQLRRYDPVRHLPLAYFGASTGAAAALIAAADRPDTIRAVVSRGGRPDLAGSALARVRAPTLLIVGGADTTVLELNEDALARIDAPKRLAVVPGATHLFEEPGALQQVARLAGDWLAQHLHVAERADLTPTSPEAL